MATAPIRPLAGEPPYATGAAQRNSKKTEKQTNKQTKKNTHEGEFPGGLADKVSGIVTDMALVIAGVWV